MMMNNITLTGYSSDEFLIEQTSPYFHVYLFPHNEKRYYKKYLTLIGDSVKYLGVILKNKNNGHWDIKKQKTIRIVENKTIQNKSNLKCIYCEVKLIKSADVIPNQKTIEHIIPKHRGGKITAPACRECNQEKGGLMLHSYIQLLEDKVYFVTGIDLQKLQIKITNAKKILAEIDSKYNN